MIKLKAAYDNEAEMKKLIDFLKTCYGNKEKVSKDYKNKGKYTRVYIELS